MAKQLKADAIEAADISRYLEEQDDFALELRCMQCVHEHGLSFDHAGTYIDPVTGKARQFDIRASLQRGGNKVTFAIESKSLGKNFPLIVSRLPRSHSESFLDRIDGLPKQTQPLDIARLPGSPLYPVNGPVVKSTVQLGRTPAGVWSATDADTFEKWTQAIASALDLADKAIRRLLNATAVDQTEQTVLLPVLVVSNDTLWAVDYDEHGRVQFDPCRLEQSSMFVGQEHSNMRRLAISHLHICTEKGLADLLQWFSDDENLWKSLFGK
ncbi:hypothetical protein [Caballeronia grimmiae]|uniref:hypothetical protein n=1 Tax=Caballeronia grimmiae TaxID=1071679 RepID=UPI0038BA8E38